MIEGGKERDIKEIIFMPSPNFRYSQNIRFTKAEAVNLCYTIRRIFWSYWQKCQANTM